MLQLRPMPMSWPVGVPGNLRGIVDRSTSQFIRYDRTARGATESLEERIELSDLDDSVSGWDEAREEVELLDALGSEIDYKGFLAGEVTPIFFARIPER